MDKKIYNHEKILQVGEKESNMSTTINKESKSDEKLKNSSLTKNEQELKNIKTYILILIKFK